MLYERGNVLFPASKGAAYGRDSSPPLTDPAVVTQVTAAQAYDRINLSRFDLELGKRWKQGEQWTYRVFAGPRFLNMDQKYYALYSGGDVGPGGSDVVRRNLNFNGAGLRGGGEVD